MKANTIVRDVTQHNEQVLTSSLVVLAATIILSTCLRERSRGEVLVVDGVRLRSLLRSEGEEGSLTRIRLNELGDFPGDLTDDLGVPDDLLGDFLGLILFFFFIDNGSTEVVDDRVGVREISLALGSSGGGSRGSSSEMSASMSALK